MKCLFKFVSLLESWTDGIDETAAEIHDLCLEAADLTIECIINDFFAVYASTKSRCATGFLYLILSFVVQRLAHHNGLTQELDMVVTGFDR